MEFEHFNSQRPTCKDDDNGNEDRCDFAYYARLNEFDRVTITTDLVDAENYHGTEWRVISSSPIEKKDSLFLVYGFTEQQEWESKQGYRCVYMRNDKGYFCTAN